MIGRSVFTKSCHGSGHSILRKNTTWLPLSRLGSLLEANKRAGNNMPPIFLILCDSSLSSWECVPQRICWVTRLPAFVGYMFFKKKNSLLPFIIFSLPLIFCSFPISYLIGNFIFFFSYLGLNFWRLCLNLSQVCLALFRVSLSFSQGLPW